MTEANVDALFRWNKPVKIHGRQIWLRTLSATDDNERMRTAMFKGRQLRVKLLAEGSPEREELMAAVEGLERTELLSVIRAYQTEEARGLSVREVQPKVDPAKPIEQTLQAAMDAEDAWDKELSEVAERRESFIKERVDTYMAILNEKTDEEVRQIAIELEVNFACTRCYTEEWQRQSLFRACYNDEEFTVRTFASALEAGDLDSRAHGKLLNEYYELDRFALDAESLKN